MLKFLDKATNVFAAAALAFGMGYGGYALAAQIAAGSGVVDQQYLMNPVVQGHMNSILEPSPGIAAPVITGSACTGALANVPLTDMAGAVVPSGAGTCIITFAHAYNNIPICVGINSSATTALPLFAATKTALTITSAAAATSVQYICIGQ